MNIPGHIVPYWRRFIESQAEDPTARFLEAFHFSDSEQSANELARLVLAGTKRATAGLLWSFEAVAERLPKVPDLSVVTNWAKEPLCVIETQRVEIVAFDQVSEEFAATEGEGDGSLAYWRQAHWSFFGRECQRIGRQPDPGMPVVCEWFRVLFRG